MFRLRSNLSAQRPLRRAAMLAAALLLIWIASQLLPTSVPPPMEGTDPVVGVASEESDANRSPSLFRPGYLAALSLLAGGAGYAWFLRRRREGGPGTRDVLQSIGKLQLGPGQQIHLVSCGDELLVIGATGSQITLLKCVPAEDKTTADPVRGYRHEKLIHTATSPEGGDGADFGAILRHFDKARGRQDSDRS